MGKVKQRLQSYFLMVIKFLIDIRNKFVNSSDNIQYCECGYGYEIVCLNIVKMEMLCDIYFIIIKIIYII